VSLRPRRMRRGPLVPDHSLGPAIHRRRLTL
jgi:hypothetical protein